MTQDEAAPQRRIALLLEYDGTHYAGSQLQPNVATIQSVLEGAIEGTTGEASRSAFAGRTDAGVHARGQVASFVSATRLTAGVIQRALNARLPRDVVVREAVEAPLELDVRRHARRRTYRYLIDNRPVRPALERERAWHVASALDLDAMAEAAQGILGVHDFAPFASPLEDATASTTRDLQRFEVCRQDATVVCEVTANAFLPHQVRRMVGALVVVGRGRMTPDAYVALLDSPPVSAGPAAPARGLYLMSVEYEPPLFPSFNLSETALKG